MTKVLPGNLTLYGGTVATGVVEDKSVEEKIARHARDGTTTSREIVVQFNADVADGMPWKFVPTQREVRVKPGESALAFDNWCINVQCYTDN